MRRGTLIMGAAARVLGVPAIVAVGAGFISLQMTREAMQREQVLPSHAVALLIAGCIIVLGVYHLVSLVTLGLHQRSIGRLRGLRAVAMTIGVVSTFLIAVDPVMLQDIGKEFYSGMLTGCAGLIFLLFAAAASPWEASIARQVIPLLSLVIGLPFFVMSAVWAVERVRVRTLWDDEKQASDVHRASFRRPCSMFCS